MAIEKRSLILSFLALILLIALWFRLPFIGTGLPFFYHEDEAHHYNRVVEMVKKGELNPRYFHKPSLHFYLRMPVVAAGFLWNVRAGHIKKVEEIKTRDAFGVAKYAFTTSHSGIVKWNRTFSVALSLLIVFLSYLIGKMLLRSEAAGLGAALFTAISPELVSNSAIIGVDVVMSFFCVLSVLAAIYLYRDFSWSKLVLCGVLCGLAFSSKYNALPIMALPLIVCLLRRRTTLAELIVAIVTPKIGFLIGSPYVLISIPLFLNQFAYEIWHYGVAGHVGHEAEPGLGQLAFYISWLKYDALGIVIVVLGVVGFFAMLYKLSREKVVFLSFPILFLLLMISQKANFTRNMLVIIPFVAILSGAALGVIWNYLKEKPVIQRTALAVILILALFEPLLSTIEQRTEALKQTDSRSVADVWLSKHQAPMLDTAIAGELQFPPQTYLRKGVTKFNQMLVRPVDLYLSGFDRVVLGPEAPISEEQHKYLKLEKNFSGEGSLQRIVKNPRVDIFSFEAGEEFTSLLFNHIANFPDPALVIKANYSSNDQEPFCHYENQPAPQTEEWCWIEKRIAHVVFDNPDVLSAYKGEVTLEVMSPWLGQKVEFLLPGWSQKISIDDSAPGAWQLIKAKIPVPLLQQEKGFALRVRRVHSPLSQEMSSDTRRLGLAIRNLYL